MKRKKYNDLNEKTKMQLLNGQIIKLRNIHFIKTDEYVKVHRRQKIINEQNFQGYLCLWRKKESYFNFSCTWESLWTSAICQSLALHRKYKYLVLDTWCDIKIRKIILTLSCTRKPQAPIQEKKKIYYLNIS